ncbi:uncharacterized protein TNCV_3386831 [Trichonephila clavipes]|nr:uncharacterized protein TNCV_3386831 [Trichonephila clavipes]
MISGLFGGQIINAYGCGDTLVDSTTPPTLPCDAFPVHQAYHSTEKNAERNRYLITRLYFDNLAAARPRITIRLGTSESSRAVVSNPRSMDSCRATSPLVRLVEGEERWEVSDHPQSVFPLNWGGIEPNSSVTCMVLKATANDRRHLALCHDEFRGPRSGLCLSATRGLLATDLVILNHGQVTTPELVRPSPNYHTNGRTVELWTDLMCITPLHDGSLVVLGSNS